MMGEVASIFDGGDVISMGDVQDYVGVIQAAFAIHKDREKIRHGLWKDYPAADQCNQVKVKIDRTLRSLELIAGHPMGDNQALQENAVQELLDIINYANFAVRLLEGTVGA